MVAHLLFVHQTDGGFGKEFAMFVGMCAHGGERRTGKSGAGHVIISDDRDIAVRERVGERDAVDLDELVPDAEAAGRGPAGGDRGVVARLRRDRRPAPAAEPQPFRRVRGYEIRTVM